MDGIYNLRDEIYINEYIMGSFANYNHGFGERPGFKRKFDEKTGPVFFDANHADVEYILGDLRVKRRI